MENCRRRNFVEVAVDKDEIGIVAGDEFAFVLLGELRIGRALRVGVKSLSAGKFVFGEVGFGSGFIFARDGGVEAAEGSDGFDGIVGPEGEGNASVEEGLPSVGICSAFGTETVFGPI